MPTIFGHSISGCSRRHVSLTFLEASPIVCNKWITDSWYVRCASNAARLTPRRISSNSRAASSMSPSETTSNRFDILFHRLRKNILDHPAAQLCRLEEIDLSSEDL